MPITHKQHLKKYGYKQAAKNPYNNDEAERAWQLLVANNGEDNVWDYRILEEAFDTTQSDFAMGIMVNVVKKDTGEVGSLSQTGFMPYVPRFYYDFRRAL